MDTDTRIVRNRLERLFEEESLLFLFLVHHHHLLLLLPPLLVGVVRAHNRHFVMNAKINYKN